MLDQIWNHFDFTWDLFVTVLDTYQSVFWIMLAGFIVHWLPSGVKQTYSSWFAKLPMPLQAVSVAIIVLLIYQAVGTESPPFVYLQF